MSGRVGAAASAKTIHVDNRGLEPPEPLVRILSQVEELGPDDVLVAHNDREPRLLYPKLAARGFAAAAERQPDGSYRVTIRRATPAPGERGGPASGQSASARPADGEAAAR